MNTNKLIIFLLFVFTQSWAQTGPGGVGNDTNNVLWIRSEDISGLNNNDNITLWPDYSSHNNDLTQSNNNYNPVFRTNYVNSYPAVQFKKVRNRIRKVNINDFPTDKITAIYVNKTKNKGKDDAILSYASTADDDDFMIYSSKHIRPHIHHNFKDTGIKLNDNKWHISNTSWKKTNGDLESWKDGSREYTGTLSYPNGITSGGCFAIGADQDGIDSGYSNYQTHYGYFTEVIIYNVYLNKAQHIIVSNYLSAKYATSMLANDLYTQDDNNNGDFDFNVAGIGQADDGSNHTDSQGSGIVRINTPSTLDNGDFLFWGENIKDASYDFIQIDNETYRVNTTWRVSKINTPGSISFSVNEADINLDTSVLKCAGLKLITSSNSNFSTTTSYPLNLNSGTYSANNVNFNDGDYFSLEYSVDKTTWNGISWSNNTPDSNKKIILSGNYDMSSQPSITACDCEIQSGKNLHITDGKYLEVEYDIVNNGSILIENEGALVQHDNNSSIGGNGTFQLNKTSMPLDHYYDYVFWSSPIIPGNLTLGDIRPDSWRYYRFDPTIVNNPGQIYPGWVQISTSDIAQAGVGYAISAPDNHAAGNTISASFIKGNDPFNNGNINVNIYKRGGPDNIGDNNLLGNPYPSAIDFHRFANDNPTIDGNFGLWTKCAGLDGNQHHQSEGYTVYTVSGGTGTATAACNGSGSIATRYIASTQGFMVTANTDNSNVTFNNGQRVTENNDNFLNKPVNKSDIIWIDMTGDDGKFRQMAIGFYAGATNYYDRMYDAINPNYGSGFSLSSLLNEKKLIIQGLNKGQDYNQKTIALYVENNTDQNLRFHLNHYKGFKDTDIFLVDKFNNTIHNLKQSDYLDFVEAGNYSHRFEILFKKSMQHIANNTEQANKLHIFQQNNLINIKTTNIHSIIRKITIFDLSQRLLYHKDKIDNHVYQIDSQTFRENNMLIFRIELNNQQPITKKVLIK